MKKSDEIKRLENDLGASPELRKKFTDTVGRIAAEGQAMSDGEAFEKAAAELGYTITAAELERLSAEMQEINPDELALASGGEDVPEDVTFCLFSYGCFEAWHKHVDEKGHEYLCLTAWHCATATLHTSADDKYVMCWSDHQCYAVNVK